MKQPAGALPGGIVTKVGIALIAVLVAGLLFSSSLAGPDEDEVMTGAPSEPQAVDDRTGRSLEGRLRDETERQTQQAASGGSGRRGSRDSNRNVEGAGTR